MLRSKKIWVELNFIKKNVDKEKIILAGASADASAGMSADMSRDILRMLLERLRTFYTLLGYSIII